MLAATLAPSRRQRAPAALRAPWPLPNLGYVGGRTGSTLISQLLQAKATPAHRQAQELSSPEAGWLGSPQDWLSRAPVTAAELPGAGVPSMGPEDRALCWCCGPERSCWAARGSPAGGHCGPWSQCGHVLGQDHTDGQMLGQLRALVEEEEGAWAALSSRPAFPEMGSEELRLASFCDWPLTTTVRPELLAAAGFFHTGPQDKVRCFFCSGGLQTWERGDDPWTEHAKWFPRCEFLLQTKGRAFVCSVQESLRHPLGSWDPWEEPADAAPAASAPAHPTPRGETRLADARESGAQDAEEQLRRLQEERTCKVRLGQAVSNVFVPCGHLVCAACAPSLRLCPLCRAPIHSCVRTFLS